MVRVILEKNREGEITGFQVEGHAGFDVHGKDIVCAAVSVLAQTTVLSIREILKLEPEQVRVKEGHLVFRLGEVEDAEKRREARLLLRTMARGMEETCASYPRHLSLEYRSIP